MMHLGSTRRRMAAMGTAVLAVVAAVGTHVATASDVPTAPVVHCSWILPTTGTAPELTYGPDDDVSVAGGQAGTPCRIGSDGVVHQGTGSPLAQLFVDPDGTGAGRQVQLWTAVSHPDGDLFGATDGSAGSVTWTVSGPDGQAVATVSPTGRSCGGDTEPGPMWSAASSDANGTGVFDRATIIDDNAGLWRSCRQGRVRIFTGSMALPSGSACGSYSVTSAATAGGATTPASYGFEVRCPAGVSLDASSISWSVDPGGSAVVRGDRDPATPNAPTITNTGTKALQLGISFSPLRRPDGTASAATFGAVIVPAVGDRAAVGPLAATREGWFTGPESVLCPGSSVQINVTVHAPEDLELGQYSGGLRILSKAGGLC
jgi:hypothetical protein